MVKIFSEEQVHQHLYCVGLGAVISDAPEVEAGDVEADNPEYRPFELWQIIKARAFAKLRRIHQSVRYGEFIASKLKLPIDNTRPMEMDLIGHHEDGLFVLELKVDRAAERNAFSELLAYSYYIAEMFALSGTRDITNVLVANLDAKITRQAFLYDLLVADRDIIIYQPEFVSETLESLQLRLYLPADEDFRAFTNELLSHETMACVVASFHDFDGWFDSEEEGGNLNEWTREHLEKLSAYTAQLMEAEGLHGFCFVRKPWAEIQLYYRNSLFVCALNPFQLVGTERANAITAQVASEHHGMLFEAPASAFDGRLIRLVKRAVKDALTHDYSCEVETPLWYGVLTSLREVVFTHNFGFRPTGMLREAYIAHLNNLYAQKAVGSGHGEDISTLKINEVTNWLRAWTFMEMCGFKEGIAPEADEDKPK